MGSASNPTDHCHEELAVDALAACLFVNLIAITWKHDFRPLSEKTYAATQYICRTWQRIQSRSLVWLYRR